MTEHENDGGQVSLESYRIQVTTQEIAQQIAIYERQRMVDELLANIEEISPEDRVGVIMSRALKGDNPEKAVDAAKAAVEALHIYEKIQLEVSQSSEQKQLPEVTPPKDALFLMYLFHNREHRVALLGDMEEDFHEAVKLFNPQKAMWLYRIGVLRSLWPSIMAWCARGAVFSKLLEWFHKFAG